MSELKHVGVLGMRWGRRKNPADTFAGKASAKKVFDNDLKKIDDNTNKKLAAINAQKKALKDKKKDLNKKEFDAYDKSDWDVIDAAKKLDAGRKKEKEFDKLARDVMDGMDGIPSKVANSPAMKARISELQAKDVHDAKVTTAIGLTMIGLALVSQIAVNKYLK